MSWELWKTRLQKNDFKIDCSVNLCANIVFVGFQSVNVQGDSEKIPRHKNCDISKNTEIFLHEILLISLGYNHA